MNSPRIRLNLPRLGISLALILSAVVPAVLPAQTAATGSISGRVFNPANSQYVANAEVAIEGSNRTTYTGTDGSFRFLNVPPGRVTVVVNYTGYEPATSTVTVEAGGSSQADFRLRFSDGTKEGPIKLDAFTVSTERDGNAKAIMDQRASLNFRNVLAADSFGENPDGNVGEFLKLMPGVTVDYAFIQARGLRLNGLDPKYSSMSMDGISLSSAGTAAFGAASRSIEMDAFSFSGIEAVELNKTRTASMDGGSVTGNVNLRSKNAFDREGRLVTYNFALVANSFEMHFKKSPGWLQEKQRKIAPSVALSYADVFFDRRLGIQLTYSDSSRWSPRDFQAITYDFSALGTRGPLITQLQVGDEAVMVRGTTAGMNADFKATDKLVLSLRSTYSQRELPGNRRLFNLITTPANILPDSTLTRIVTRPDGANTRLQEAGDVLNSKFTTAESYGGRFKFRHSIGDFSGGIDYSRGIARYKDVSVGLFTIGITRLSSMSWMAERSDPFSTDWNVTQLSGRNWMDPANYNLDSAVANNIGSRERRGTTEKLSGNVDAVIPLPIISRAITLRTGVKSQEVRFKLRGVGAQNWTYLGPATSQTNPAARMPTETIYNNDRAMNAGVPDWPYPDRQRLFQIYQANPNYYTQDPVASFREKLIYPRTVKEQIDSAYAEGNAEFGALRLQTGLRYENTDATGQRVEQIPTVAITRARPDLVPNTIPYVLYQYHNGEQRKSASSYDDLFWNAGAKYRIRKNLDTQFSVSDGILRPDYNNIAGTISFNETTRVVTVPNPELKPERSTKYYAGASYYFEPAGALSFGVYALRTRDLQIPGRQMSRADAGYDDYAEFADYTFLGAANDPTTQTTRGLEVEYRQQLTFLPGALKGLGIYGSFSRVIADRERLGVVNRSGSGGVAYRFQRWSARLNGTWQNAYLTRKLTSTTGNGYMDERTSIDAEFGVRVYRNVTVYLNGRNITNSPFVLYNIPSSYGKPLEDSIARYGAFWTLGVKSQF